MYDASEFGILLAEIRKDLEELRTALQEAETITRELRLAFKALRHSYDVPRTVTTQPEDLIENVAGFRVNGDIVFPGIVPPAGWKH